MMTSPILGVGVLELLIILILLVVGVRFLLGVLVRPGLLLRILFGFALLVMAAVVAMVFTIGQSIRQVGPGGSGMPSVRVSPLGVEVDSGTGNGVSVTPFGVQVRGQANSGKPMIRVDTGLDPATVTSEQARTVAADHVAIMAAEQAKQARELVAREQERAAQRGSQARAMEQMAQKMREQASAMSSSTAPIQADLPAEAPESPVPKPAQPQPLLADHFDPDVYQSEGAAIRGLTNQMASLLDTVTAAGQDPRNIVIKGKISQPVLSEMMNALRKIHPSANIYWSRTPTRVDGQTIILYACRETDPAEQPADTAESTQTLRMDATGSEGKISRSARFLDKPWVDDFAIFASRNGQRVWIKALSRSPAVTAGEAEQQAIDDAVSQLEPRVRDRARLDGRDAISWMLQRQIRAALQDSGMIRDRFVQRFERPYGELWQVALLIDASSKRIGSLAEKCDRVLAVQQRTYRQTALSVAGVIALVCVVYVFLNSVTRGYFVWSLRAGALAIIAGGVFLVLLLSHNEPAIEGFLR